MNNSKNENILEKYDYLICKDDISKGIPKGPENLYVREGLCPSSGHYTLIAPPTYPLEDKEKKKGRYNIDKFSDGTSYCTIDSKASQVNRMIKNILSKFSGDGTEEIIPSITINAKYKTYNGIEAPHKLADACFRICRDTNSKKDFVEELEAVFKDVSNGDFESLFKIHPMSILFGIWDSRGSGIKLGRLINSIIIGREVKQITSSSSYNPLLDYEKEELLSDSKDKAKMSNRGFNRCLDSSLGGVLSNTIEHIIILNLSQIKNIHCKRNPELSIKMQRYILGLLLFIIANREYLRGYLRQGCSLVLDQNKTSERISEIVWDGKREAFSISKQEAKDYLNAVSKEVHECFEMKNRYFEVLASLLKKDLSKKDDVNKKE